jgi:IS4 transposase
VIDTVARTYLRDAVDVNIDRFMDEMVADRIVLRLREFLSKEVRLAMRRWLERRSPAHNASNQPIERIDVEVKTEFQRDQYEGTRSLDTKRFRVVVREQDADDRHPTSRIYHEESLSRAI